MKTETNLQMDELLTVALPREIIDDLCCIAQFNDTTVEDLVYSYIMDGVINDSRDARRMRFTEKTNKFLNKNNIPTKTIEDIFENLVY